MKEIKLTRGQTALVDDEDFEWLNQWRWFADKTNGNYYVRRSILINGLKNSIRIHRLILGCIKGDGKIIDHIDGNPLNNQRKNLRICTHSQNQSNRKSSGVSKYLGVSIYKNNVNGKIYTYWIANIGFNSKRKTLGYFKTEEEAALKYNNAAKFYHGEFARLNIIEK